MKKCQRNSAASFSRFLERFFYRLMSVVVYIFGCYCFNFVKLTSVLIRTRSISQTLDCLSEIMSIQSIDTVSSCEIAGDDYMLNSRSPEISSSTKSDVLCSFAFKEVIPGTSFIITGVVLKSCERFSINLVAATPKHDIALHFNPRLPQNYIVRNSKIAGKIKNSLFSCKLCM